MGGFLRHLVVGGVLFGLVVEPRALPSAWAVSAPVSPAPAERETQAMSQALTNWPRLGAEKINHAAIRFWHTIRPERMRIKNPGAFIVETVAAAVSIVFDLMSWLPGTSTWIANQLREDSKTANRIKQSSRLETHSNSVLHGAVNTIVPIAKSPDSMSTLQDTAEVPILYTLHGTPNSPMLTKQQLAAA